VWTSSAPPSQPSPPPARHPPGAAEGLRIVMYDWEKAGIDWLAASQREGYGRLDEHSERFQEAWQAKRSPDRAFEEAARRALDTEGLWL